MMRKYIFVFFMFLFTITQAQASHITLEPTVNLEVSNGIFQLEISIKNSGDEDALNVVPELSVLGDKYRLKSKKALKPGESFVWDKSIVLDKVSPGSYPFVLVTNYQDNNLYSFSNVMVDTFDYAVEKLSPKISAKLNRLNLELENNSNSSISAKIRLITPKEIECKDAIRNVPLEPRKKKNLRFGIKNLSALVGSSYQIYAVVEYSNQVVVVSENFQIKRKLRLFGINYYFWCFILFMLIVLFIKAQFLKGDNGPSRPTECKWGKVFKGRRGIK